MSLILPTFFFGQPLRNPEVIAGVQLTRRRLKNGVFHLVVDLQAAINRFIKEHNKAPRPFVWKADPDQINAAVRRGHQTLESIHSHHSIWEAWTNSDQSFIENDRCTCLEGCCWGVLPMPNLDDFVVLEITLSIQSEVLTDEWKEVEVAYE